MELSATTITDITVAPLWIVSNVVAAMFAHRLSVVVYGCQPQPIRLASALTVYLGTILVVTLLLGALGALHGWLLLTVVAIGSSVGWLGLRRVESPAELMRDQRATGSDSQLAEPASWTNAAIFMVWGLLAAFAIGHVVVEGLLRFPDDFESLMYHLPIMNQWLQAESLLAPDDSFWWTPGVSEAVGLWMVAPYTGDFLLALNNLPFVVLWAGSVVALSRELQLPRVWSHLAAAGSLLVYTTLHELDDAGNDLALVAFCMAATAFLLRFLTTTRLANLVFFSVALGFLCGVKYSALPYAALLWCGLTIGLWYRDGPRTALRSSAVSLLIALPLCGYWYLRNWFVSGSPIYPMGLTADIATGYGDIWSTTLLGNQDPRVPEMTLHAFWIKSGPIHVFAAAVAPLSIVALIISARSAAKSHDKSLAAGRALLAIWLLASGILLLVSPFCAEDRPNTLNRLGWAANPIRYGLCFLTYAVVAWAWLGAVVSSRIGGVWGHSRGGETRLPQAERGQDSLGNPQGQLVAVGLFFLLAGWQIQRTIDEGWVEFEFADSFLVGVNVFAVGLVGWLFARTKRHAWALAPVSLIAASVGIGFLSNRWHDGYGEHYDNYFNTGIFGGGRDTAKLDVPRVCVLPTKAYPLFGSRRQTRVFRPRNISSYEELLRQLRDREFELVVAQGFGDDYFLYPSSVHEWIAADQTNFKLEIERGLFTVYRLQASATREAMRPSHSRGPTSVSAR